MSAEKSSKRPPSTERSGPVLGLIPARGGSKGIPRKNVRPLAGRPLILYTCDAALASRRLDRVVCSTDDEEIAEAARKGRVEAPFRRPGDLARDDTPMIDVVRHALDRLSAEGYIASIFVLLQPTAPLRTARHVDESIDLLIKSGADSVVSVVEVPHQFHPGYVLRDEGGRLVFYEAGGERRSRRQELEPVYSRNGAVYVCWRETIERYGNLYGEDCRPYVMAAAESVNLDTEDDWRLAEMRLAGSGR